MLGKGTKTGRLREHFIYQNWKVKVAILQEGPALLLWCGHWGMHTSAAQMETHRMTSRCDKSTDMSPRQRDVDMEERCGEMEFILYGMEGGVLVEGVAQFEYMGLPLDQTDDNWP